MRPTTTWEERDGSLGGKLVPNVCSDSSNYFKLNGDLVGTIPHFAMAEHLAKCGYTVKKKRTPIAWGLRASKGDWLQFSAFSYAMHVRVVRLQFATRFENESDALKSVYCNQGSYKPHPIYRKGSR